MKKTLFNMKSVITGSYKAIAGAGAKTCWKSEPEPKQIVSAPQHCMHHTGFCSPVLDFFF
jgi:hypothetical protein